MTKTLIGRIIKGNREDPNYIDTIDQLRTSQKRKIDAVVEEVELFVGRKQAIWRASQIGDSILQRTGVGLKTPFVA